MSERTRRENGRAASGSDAPPDASDRTGDATATSPRPRSTDVHAGGEDSAAQTSPGAAPGAGDPRPDPRDDPRDAESPVTETGDRDATATAPRDSPDAAEDGGVDPSPDAASGGEAPAPARSGSGREVPRDRSNTGSIPPPTSRRRIGLVAALVGVVTTLLLVRGHQDVGYVRDEGIYFVASRSYGGWAARLLKEPGEAMEARARDRAFAVNHEHPALMKLAAGVSARVLAEPSATPPAGEALREPPADGLLHLLPEGAAMRLPAQVLAGLGAALLVLAGASMGGSLLAGLLAAGWFILLPRVWFNAGLHCFDVPVAVATLAVALAYRAALVDRRWALALGPILGVAIAIKHNALFLPLLFGLHYAVCLLRAGDGARRQPRLWLPLGVVSVAVVAPVVAVALWPWLWTAPLQRLQEYFAFHRLHAYYNTEFLGTNYNQPPLPESYPFVLTWATVPSVLLVLALIGLGVALWRDLTKKTGNQEATSTTAPRRWSAPLRPQERHDGLLLALLAAFPLALIALPTVPIFGGTKHWLTAYPFLALAAAIAWGALWRRAALPRRWRQAPGLALLVVLVPSAWSTIHSHPNGLSQYAPLAGGARGAGELGLLRGFWGHSLTPLLPTIADLDRRRLYLHDLHQLSREQYLREGRWPAEVGAAAPRQADAGLLFYERHMLTYEVELWNGLGVTFPYAIVELDDVPLTSLYVGD